MADRTSEAEAGAVAGGGLTTPEATARLRQYGPNAIPEERPHLAVALLRRLWGPVPWMLEATLVLQLVLGKQTDAIVIASLLVLNAVLGFVQEHRAQNALAVLRERLTIQVRVRRDGCWQLRPAEDLVPDDVLRLRAGDLVPADVRVLEGEVAIDQSALTGESLPVDVVPRGQAYAGALVKRGEVTARVVATGTRTTYGKTAQLVRTAKAASHLETTILAIVRYLVALDVVLVAAVLAYAGAAHLAMTEVLPFALILLVASVPVALPATFTLAEAIGSLELAGRGVLVTRLAAVEEAAAMDVLCSDKTGTMTKNELTVAAVRAEPPHTEDDVLRLAALACDEATQDPIDLAILEAARSRALPLDLARRRRFIPFDPAIKRSEALVEQDGASLRIVKGTPTVVGGLCGRSTGAWSDVDRLAAEGFRVLAVAVGAEEPLGCAGLVGLHDPPRDDSAAVVARLHALGVRVLMVTGDGVGTARAIGARVGVGDRAAPAEVVREGRGAALLDYDVFAGIYPEDKFRLVQGLQRAGHTVGMTGDGVNDAPALKQAEIGIAVANATDVAKGAASVVLTRPGLADAVAAVDEGRRIYQRMLTYTLNKIIKTFEIALLLSVGLLVTGAFVTTPHLIVLLLFTNDFVTMALATDRVVASPRPERWRVRSIVASALPLAVGWLLFSFATFFVGRDVLGLDVPRLQTLIFAMLVFSGQATVYLVRERRHAWASAPSRWMLAASVADVLVVGLLASRGILMSAAPLAVIGALLVLVVLYATALDFVKVGIFRRSGVR